MIVEIFLILLTIAIFIYFYRKTNNKNLENKETMLFHLNMNQNDNENKKKKITTVYDKLDNKSDKKNKNLEETQTMPSTESEMIDNYRINFFKFNDHINNTSHLMDSVDALNMTNNAQDYRNGLEISHIYDDLVAGIKYKN